MRLKLWKLAAIDDPKKSVPKAKGPAVDPKAVVQPQVEPEIQEPEGFDWDPTYTDKDVPLGWDKFRADRDLAEGKTRYKGPSVEEEPELVGEEEDDDVGYKDFYPKARESSAQRASTVDACYAVKKLDDQTSYIDTSQNPIYMTEHDGVVSFYKIESAIPVGTSDSDDSFEAFAKKAIEPRVREHLREFVFAIVCFGVGPDDQPGPEEGAKADEITDRLAGSREFQDILATAVSVRSKRQEQVAYAKMDSLFKQLLRDPEVV